MKFLSITALIAMAGLAQAAPSPALAPREGCDQGECPAINAGYDYIEGRQVIGAEIRVSAHGVCKTWRIYTGDGCAVFEFDGGYEEKICIDTDRNRSTRTGTKGFLFHQCWLLNRSEYCDRKPLWTPSQEVDCTWGPAGPHGGEVSADGWE